VAVVVWLAYFNGCNREYTTVNSDYEKELLQSNVDDANSVIDSLMQEIIDIRYLKQSVVTRIEKRNIYITEKGDTVRKLIKDSVVLAYVDTLEVQLSDYDSLVKTQIAEILKLDQVIIQKDTIIYNKDLIQALTEREVEVEKNENKKLSSKIKGLKITAIALPIGVFVLTLLAK
jgi:hypothetical protein